MWQVFQTFFQHGNEIPFYVYPHWIWQWVKTEEDPESISEELQTWFWLMEAQTILTNAQILILPSCWASLLKRRPSAALSMITSTSALEAHRNNNSAFWKPGSNFPPSLWFLLQIVGPADGSNYIVDYYGARLTRLSITNETFRKPHHSLWAHLDAACKFLGLKRQ